MHAKATEAFYYVEWGINKKFYNTKSDATKMLSSERERKKKFLVSSKSCKEQFGKLFPKTS